MKKTILTGMLLTSILTLSGQASAERVDYIGATFGSSSLRVNTLGGSNTATENGYGIARHDVGDTRSIRSSYIIYNSHSVLSLQVFYNLVHNKQWVVGIGGGGYLDFYSNTNNFLDYKGLTLDAIARYRLDDSHLSLDAGYSTRVTGLDAGLDGYNTMYLGVSLGF